MDNNIWIKSSATLAKRLHKDQVDKAGVDYFEGHLCMVASMGKTWQEQVVGYLHDASEDTPNTVEEVLSLLEKEAQQRLIKKIGRSCPLHYTCSIITILLIETHIFELSESTHWREPLS